MAHILRDILRGDSNPFYALVVFIKKLNMELQKVIEKYEQRNKSRLKRLEEEERDNIRTLILSLYNETLEIINDLKTTL